VAKRLVRSPLAEARRLSFGRAHQVVNGGDKPRACRCVPLPPVATLAAAWAPPAMTPWLRTKANIKPPSRASAPPPPPIAVPVPGRPTPSRLRLAVRCGERQAHAECHCPARGIPDYLTAINHSLQPLCTWWSDCWGQFALTGEYCRHRSDTQAWAPERSRLTRERDARRLRSGCILPGIIM